jgi:hypothetical protein
MGVESGLEVEEEREKGKDRYMFNPGNPHKYGEPGEWKGD